MGIHSTIVAATSSSTVAQVNRPSTPPTMFPPATDSPQEDPSSQVPWPGRRPRKTNGDGTTTTHDNKPTNGNDPAKTDSPPKNKKTLGDLIALTISMAGAQIAWTVELGYGTPFLLDLGLSESLTSLVWLAGPISGLVAQPLIGAISDSSSSRYRRRYWVITSTVVLLFATLGLAYAQAIAAVLVDLFGSNQGRWDPHWQEQAKNTSIGIAVLSFYFLDFALNALQASLRNLLLDVTPAEQLGKANAWHGRMTHAGNIIGFGFGFLDLAGWRILRPLGGGQFRKVCIVAITILVITVWITCITQEEKGREGVQSEDSEMMDIVRNIYRAVGTLPRPVKRVCFVQICAFMGWFPFLFYSTTWVGEIMAVERDEDPPAEEATRAGEFALLIYSLVAVIAGTVLPYLAARDARLLKQIDAEMEDPDEELLDMDVL
ncbi:hypothetical protein FRC02_007679 [Tulasnella sp. 418]|nr:hypothetical protein FRC02_007679 [Tulasnella sp. 418]